MSVEILAPAGNAECFKAAVYAGANAIYIGLNEFSARKSAENFSIDNLEQYVSFAHLFDVKVYVAVNTLVKNSELPLFFEVISKAYEKGVDAFILQDMFLGKYIKEALPEICLHLSTQAGVCNELGAVLAKEYGFDRVILARETRIEDMEKIAKIIETEAFVQGALCSSFSGHCYMSSFAGGMSGNRGFCKQPCRKKYVYSGNGFKSFKGYNLSLSDLCLKDFVEVLSESGISSFKIEGRMRSPEYVYSAVRVYSDALNGISNEDDFRHLKRSFNRGNYTKGYITPFTRNIISSKIQGNIGDYIGKVIKHNNRSCMVGVNEEFCVGDGFKILRNQEEVGSGVFSGQVGKSLNLSVSGNVRAGDEVYITKDAAYSKSIVSCIRRIPLKITLQIYADSFIKCEFICKKQSGVIYSDFKCEQASKAPVGIEDVIKCFSKTDGYPFDVDVVVAHLDNVFVAKSQLNAFRRKCFDLIYSLLTKVERRPVALLPPSDFNVISVVNNNKIALISNDFNVLSLEGFDRFIFRPNSYKDVEVFKKIFDFESDKEKYLYLPPYASGSDLLLIFNAAKYFDGIYTEGYYGIEVAKRLGKKLMLGTGVNIFNSYDAFVASKLCDGNDFVYSKEMSIKEISSASVSGFVFALGNIQVMDLIYCPFSFDCKNCNRGDRYSLVDDDKRCFTVRRYKMNECRFEVYNPYNLVSDFNKHQFKLYDFTLFSASDIKKIISCGSVDCVKQVIGDYTSGALINGIK